MKKLLSLYIILLCVSCGTEPKKEKFSYDRVKEEPKEVVDSSTIILNSNDQMLFDKSVLKAKAGEEVSLLLNHTGKIGKEFMVTTLFCLKVMLMLMTLLKQLCLQKKMSIYQMVMTQLLTLQ